MRSNSIGFRTQVVARGGVFRNTENIYFLWDFCNYNLKSRMLQLKGRSNVYWPQGGEKELDIKGTLISATLEPDFSNVIFTFSTGRDSVTNVSTRQLSSFEVNMNGEYTMCGKKSGQLEHYYLRDY